MYTTSWFMLPFNLVSLCVLSLCYVRLPPSFPCEGRLWKYFYITGTGRKGGRCSLSLSLSLIYRRMQRVVERVTHTHSGAFVYTLLHSHTLAHTQAFTWWRCVSVLCTHSPSGTSSSDKELLAEQSVAYIFPWRSIHIVYFSKSSRTKLKILYNEGKWKRFKWRFNIPTNMWSVFKLKV